LALFESEYPERATNTSRVVPLDIDSYFHRADYLGTDVAVKEFLDISDQPGFDVQKYIGREVEILG